MLGETVDKPANRWVLNCDIIAFWNCSEKQAIKFFLPELQLSSKIQNCSEMGFSICQSIRIA